MPRPGGEADKLGNLYEAGWTVECVLDVFRGKFLSITVESFGDESQGVDFHLEKLDRTLQFHSVKRQTQERDWAIKALCKKDPSTSRSILSDLISKRHTFANAELRFISATGANDLRELTERAETPTSVKQFRQVLSARLKTLFDDHIIDICENDEEFAFTTLKSLEVVLRSHRDLFRNVDRRIEEFFYREDGSELRPDDVRRMIAEFIHSNLGATLTVSQVRKHIYERGLRLRDWKSEQTVLDKVASINSRYLSIVQAELINDAQIVRDESAQIVESIYATPSRGVLLLAPGGFGKSCVLAQVVTQLLARDIPVLCLRMDSFQVCNTSRQLGAQLDLPASPALVLSGISDNTSSVIVIDQLDAMSLISGRHPMMWEVFQQLCDEVQSYSKMKIILACRDFELKHDHRLRRLGEDTSGFLKLSLGKLNEAEILKSIEASRLSQFTLTKQQFDILGIPFHLLLFLQGDPAKTFASVAELYNRYWNRKRENLRLRLGRESQWTEVIEALTSKMSRDQVLFAPKLVVDNWEEDAKAMISEHVLIEIQDRNLIRFFHESFFDYAYARRFCANGESILSLLLSTEQHLFRRAQVRQILSYRRENDFAQYINDIRDLLESPHVRFHLKRMVASGFSQIDKPTLPEWEVIQPYLLTGDLSRYVSSSLRNHLGWFELLDNNKVFDNWLASGDEMFVDSAIWYLESPELQETYSSRVTGLVSPYLGQGDNWEFNLKRVMHWGKIHKSLEMKELYLDMVRRGYYDEAKDSPSANDDLWDGHYNLAKDSPRFLIDILATWFPRIIKSFDDGTSLNYLSRSKQVSSHTGALIIGEAASAEPEYFVENTLPMAIETVLETAYLSGDQVRDRTWPWLTNHGDPYSVEDAVLLHLRRSLEWLAQFKAESHAKHTSTITEFPHHTFSYLLLRSWAANPEAFADQCAQYFVSNRVRLNIGYSSWSGIGEGSGKSAISRIALKAVSPHCSIEMFRQLEKAVIGYSDEYEKKTPRIRGHAELLLLRSLDSNRVSRETLLRIEELERKFPTLSDAIVEEDRSGLSRAVGSPISHDVAILMTDKQWISAMLKYDGSTDSFYGGPHELSRLLADFAQKDRQRFSQLVQRIPDSVNSVYFSAILEGICNSFTKHGKEDKERYERELASTPVEFFLDVILRLHGLPNRPCGAAIVSCIGMLAHKELSEGITEILSYYAISDRDPDRDMWMEKKGGNSYYDGNPLNHGINTVRGQSARAIASLLYADESRCKALLPTLNALSKDPIISVRTCAIEAFLPILNYSRDLAVDLFIAACSKCDVMCANMLFDEFLYYSIQTHYPQLRELILFALNSTCDGAVKNAAHHIILAELNSVDVGQDAQFVRSGSEEMRKTAAKNYAHNVKDESVRSTCIDYLTGYLNDEAESVRQEVSRALWGLSGEQLLILESFILQFIESKSFEIETDRLLRTLEESNAALPRIVCRAAERILEFIGNGTSIANRGSMIAHSLSTLIVRQYEQSTDPDIKSQCLDLIDRMELSGFYGVGEELSKIDR